MQCSSYSLLKLHSYQLQTFYSLLCMIFAYCKLLVTDGSVKWLSQSLIHSTVLLGVINFITSLLFVATAAVQYFPAGYPSKPYCTCYTPPFWSEAHTYVKSLMLLATSLVWEREEDSGRAKREPRISFSLPDPARRPPSFSIVSTDRELEQATLMRSVMFFFPPLAILANF